jgi:hypothetical protein
MQKEFGRQREEGHGGREVQIPDDFVERVAKEKGIHSEITKSSRELSTEEAIKIRIEEGDTEAGYLDNDGVYHFNWSVSAVNEGLRRLGFRETQARTRWQADYALQLWQIDSSRSKYIQIEEPIRKNGRIVDWICRVSDRELHYKDAGSRIRTWVVQSMDDHSRLRHVTYHAAPAESGMLWVEHMRHALQHNDPNHLVADAPDQIYHDHGAAGKSSEFTGLLDALDIDVMKSAPWNSEARGKIERGFSSLWQTFEAPLSTRLVKRLGRGCYVKLSRINRMVHNFCVREHSNRHPWFRKRSRGQVYQVSLVQRAREVEGPWPRSVEVDLLDLATRTWIRDVTKAREVSVEGLLFEAPNYAKEETIRVHRTAQGDWMGELLSSYREGETFRLKPYRPEEVDNYERTRRPEVYRDKVQGLAEEELDEVESRQEEAEQEVEDLMSGEAHDGKTGQEVDRPDSETIEPDAPALRADDAEGLPLIRVRQAAGEILDRIGVGQQTRKDIIDKLVRGDVLKPGMTRKDVENTIDQLREHSQKIPA